MVFSVARHGRINLQRPGINAALQVDHVAKAVLRQVHGHLQATHAVVAQAANRVVDAEANKAFASRQLPVLETLVNGGRK